MDQICCRASYMMRISRYGIICSCTPLQVPRPQSARVRISGYIHQLGFIDRLQSVQITFLVYLNRKEPDRHPNKHQLHPLVVRREKSEGNVWGRKADTENLAAGGESRVSVHKHSSKKPTETPHAQGVFLKIT
ncbi:hypothetical protein J6590_063908 [Homalodisca vitripennis]|nr:hypothetical protein J6590_063908 [Homalodisca vitripennis]